ncbi:MAG: hypothetical protein OEY96_05420 [Gammaproteobacteria bacterium]|nr:hypothetical protein [Gammaproteobacteria bacterium]
MNKYIALLIVLPFASTSYANELPSCDIEIEKPIFISNKHAEDTLSVHIKGEPCHKADLEILIKDVNDKEIYQYRAPFKPHIAVQWDDKDLNKFAKQFAQEAFKEYRFGHTNKLPEWMPKEEYYEENYQELEVSKEYYLSILSKSWQTFSHMTHYEGWQIIAFDQNSNKFVLISKGGL